MQKEKERIMKRHWSMMACRLVLVAGMLMLPSMHPLDAADARKKKKPKPMTQAQCLDICQSEYDVCTKNCDKKNTLQDQSDCTNKCISNWYCCQDVCYGTRKSCL